MPYIYVLATSSANNLRKIGMSGRDVRMRCIELNSRRYGGRSDWYVEATCWTLGDNEKRIHSMLESRRHKYDNCRELFEISRDDAVRALYTCGGVMDDPMELADGLDITILRR